MPIIVVAFITVLYLFSTVERYEDYESINEDFYDVFDNLLTARLDDFIATKDKAVKDIRENGKTLKELRPKGDYLPTDNYPFYDGSAFYDSTPVHSVMTGIPSLYSGGDLKSKPNKYQPFEIANYNPGIARSSSDIQAPANF